ncbi:MAG: alternative ribosome rescue aminoacyl-tRNA hydrolase ArfB [Sphaerochaetaceae bacterium]|nr:alternative ribosome rescue aminoacyl-tRNA hydrolase ArfB [Spirochaetales bacterium]MDY5500362.1 alternative ribosome rescue aminoacyl-tRNA hydrolase ArfB [Sphaerochaetaceae bacterium]
MDNDAIANSIQKGARLTFSRSGGNGGQNVNKVNTKVHLSLQLSALQGISELEMERIQKKLRNMINKDGELHLDVDANRSQELNRTLAIARMEERIREALKVQPKRHRTKPTQSANERRLKAKRLIGERKRNRSGVWQ